MYGSEHDTPLLERPTPENYAVGDVASFVDDGSFVDDDSGASRPSFLVILLRALSAWNV